MQVKADGDIEEENTYIQKVLIPGAIGIAEEVTGSILRKGIYKETVFSGQSLSKGNVSAIHTVIANGVSLVFEHKKVAGRSVISVDHQAEVDALEVTFAAGFDHAACPAPLRSWLLMVIGFLYRDRDLSSKDPKIRNLDFLLASISVPGGF